MPLEITLNGEKTRLYPENNWKTYRTKAEDIKIDRNFYIE